MAALPYIVHARLAILAITHIAQIAAAGATRPLPCQRVEGYTVGAPLWMF